MMTPLHAESSKYGTYRIVDTLQYGRPARLLYGDDNSLQSGVALDENPELLFDYNQRFLEILMSHQPRSVLVIGGGTCTLPTAAYNQFPDLAIDVVEIDQLLIELGHTFFDLPHSPRLQTIVDDALRYLEKKDKRYDVIIIDAFLGYVVPSHLVQSAAISQYRHHLTSGGVVAINFISEYKRAKPSLAHTIVAAFSKEFPHVAIYQSDPDYEHGIDQNFILTASEHEMHFDYLQSVTVEPA